MWSLPPRETSWQLLHDTLMCAPIAARPGVVIGRKGSGLRETFKVRKVSFGVGVERTFPVHSPIVEKIEVAVRGDVRRAKLYYLRDRIGKAAKIKEKRGVVPTKAAATTAPIDPTATPAPPTATPSAPADA